MKPKPVDHSITIARQRIAQLVDMVNELDRLRGGNGRKVRLEDFLENI